MSPDNHNDTFNKSGNDGCNGGTGNAHGRQSENTENQNIIQYQIGENCGNAGNHGNKGLTGFADGVDVGLADRKRNQSNHHNSQIFFAVIKGEGNISYGTVIA